MTFEQKIAQSPMTDAHQHYSKAAEHCEAASLAHKEAAKHAQNGDMKNASVHSELAHGHITQANEHSELACNIKVGGATLVTK